MHDRERKGRLLAHQVQELGLVDGHKLGAPRNGRRRCRPGGRVDQGHLAEEIARPHLREHDFMPRGVRCEAHTSRVDDEHLRPRAVFLEDDL